MLQCRVCDNLCHIQCEKEKSGSIVFEQEKTTHYWLCHFCSSRISSGQVESFIGTFDIFPYHRPVCAKKKQKRKQTKQRKHDHESRKSTFLMPPYMPPIGNLQNALDDYCLGFNDDLLFSFCGVCANKCQRNKGEILSLSRRNRETYQRWKNETRKGRCAPVQVRFFRHKDPKSDKYTFQGWSVQATEDIPANTLICEYSGNVFRVYCIILNNSFAGFSQVFD